MDLVTFTQEILNGKLHFLYRVSAATYYFTFLISYLITTTNAKMTSKIKKTLAKLNFADFYRILSTCLRTYFSGF